MMLWKRLGYLLPWRRRVAERDMQEELQALATIAGRRALGNLMLAAEDARAEWGWVRLEQTLQDVRYACRTLAKSPGFTATAVLSLAIGIGANTALFSLINTVSWKLLPVKDPEHLLVLGQQGPSSTSNGFTYQQYQRVREQAPALSVAAYGPTPMQLSIAGSAEPTLEGQLVSGSYFAVLGVRPALGRLLEPADDRVPLGHPVAVISDDYWASRFARDPKVVGREVSVSGTSFTIVGVTPPEFFGMEVGTLPKLFVPIAMQPAVMPVSENLLVNPRQTVPWLRIVGRVAPAATMAQATTSLDVLARQPDWAIGKGPRATEPVRLTLTSGATGLSDLRRQFSAPFLILIGVVATVLLVACANTGNLVLARAAARRPELVLRLALGAGRLRIVRQLLVEGLVLAALAGGCSVALAYWTTRLLVRYASAGRGVIALDLSPDARVLAFAAVVSMLAGLAFAIVPALRASRLDPTTGRRSGLATRGSFRATGPGRVLVVTQIALSLVLITAAGLFIRTLHNLHAQETRLDQGRIVIVRVEPPGSDQRNIPGATDRLDRIYRDLLARVEAIPGVQAASLARSSPTSPVGFGTTIATPSGEQRPISILMLYPRYFAAMGIPVLRGRDFGDDDLQPASRFAVVVNEAFVRDVLGGREPLGAQHGALRMIERGFDGTPRMGPFEIIGVVRDSRLSNLREAPTPTMYQTFRQTATGRGQMVLHARVVGDPRAVVQHIRREVQAIDARVPTFEIHTLAEEIDAVLVRERLIAMLSAVFGVVALVLVSVGLYGLLAFTVSRRTAEIGLRLALGATRGRVRWLIAGQSLALVLWGLAIGLPAAWLVGRVASRQLSAVLFELTPFDPATLALAAGVLAGVALCAGALPARRATRIDPIVALRSE